MNITIDMGEILIKAWKITWKFKVLWIFGILAGCASNRGSFNNGFNNGSNTRWTQNWNNGNLPEPFRRFQDMNPQQAVNSFLGQYWGIIAAAILLLCVLWFFFYFLGVMGKTGLIKGASKADAGAERLGFGELWGESLPYFWRMFFLSLLVGLPFFIITVVLLVVFFAGLAVLIFNGEAGGTNSTRLVGGLFAALAIFIPAICCLSIVSIIVNMIVEQAKNAMVVENTGVLESLRRGWNVFKRNFLTIILISIILGVLGTIVGLIVAIPLLLALAPALGSIVLLAAGSSQAVALAPLAIAGVCFLVYLPVMLVVGGIEQTYIQSALTLTYLRLTAPKAPTAPPIPLESIDAQ
jgi:hypothetical protein